MNDTGQEQVDTSDERRLRLPPNATYSLEAEPPPDTSGLLISASTLQPEVLSPGHALAELPIVSAFGDQLDTSESLAQLAYLDGRLPHMEQSMITHRLELGALVAAPWLTIKRSQRYGDGAWAAWVIGDRWEAHCRTIPEGCELRVYAPNPAIGAAAIERLCSLADTRPEIALDELDMKLQYWDRGQLVRRSKRVAASPWGSIDRNYPGSVGPSLAELMDQKPTYDDARIILFHGPPGTGKTTAARALALQWQSWCDAIYVLDPEVLFGSSSYLHTALISEAATDLQRWRLLICDDGGLLAGRDTSRDTLARLLSITDGILTHSLPVIILMSTSVDLAAIDPAILRPGRCLAAIEFPRFDRAQARTWIGPDRAGAIPAGGATLADLYSLARGVPQLNLASDEGDGSGSYL